MFLQRQHREGGHLVLRLVQVSAVESAHALDGEAQRRLPRIVRNLECAIEATEDQADPSVRIDDAGKGRQTMKLVGRVMNRRIAGGWVLDATLVVESVDNYKIIDRTDVAAILQARLQPVPSSSVHR